MYRRRTSALVESGILAAIAVIFTLIGNYVPVLDFFVSLLWPLPIILCGRRNGLMWSVLCLIVTGCVVAVLISPLQAVTQCLILGILGLVIGACMRRQMAPVQILLWGSLGAFVSFILSGLAAYFLMDINVIDAFYEAMQESADVTRQIYGMLGVSGGPVEAQMEQLQKMIGLILPAGVLLSAPITAFVNYWAARRVLARLGDYYPWLPEFATWVLPRWILGIYGVGMVLMVYFRGDDGGLGYKAGYTVYMIGSMLLLVQGLSVVKWYVIYRNKPRFWLPAAVILSFFIPLAAQLLIVMGAFDMVVNTRRLRNRPQ